MQKVWVDCTAPEPYLGVTLAAMVAAGVVWILVEKRLRRPADAELVA
ncbi:MAG TPA: hypothetical protein VNP73_12110 [Actinomycetota bacterium]|nr:hypothetical protein [Actinomycetota bacterium]